jgi:hypothetical protein
MGKRGVTVYFDGNELFLESAMIGGVVDEKTNEMTGIYVGNRDIADLGVVVMQAMRGGFKTARTEFGLNNEMAADFMTFTLAEAIKREVLHGHEGEITFRQIRSNKAKDY